MYFEDDDIKVIDPTTQSGLGELLDHLCGEQISLGCNAQSPCNRCQACMNWQVLESRLKSPALSLEDLNDILLLADQFPLGSAFFEFFLSNGEKAVTFEELKQGIVNFKEFALLRYGNVRFAYRSLYKLRKDELATQLGRWHTEPAVLKKQYGGRRSASALPREIPADLTWMLGYIAKGGADRDLATYAVMACLLDPPTEKAILAKFRFNEEQKLLYDQRKPFLQSTPRWKEQFRDLTKIEDEIKKLVVSIGQIRRHGWLNTSHYLASDCMDVYVATSMRERWEFEDVNNVVRKVFADPKVEVCQLFCVNDQV